MNRVLAGVLTIAERRRKVLRLVLTIAAVAMGQSAWAQVGIFTVSASGSTFTITRTSNTSATEKVMYRTVSLSAIAGTHFTAASGELTFDAENNTRTVTVTEKTPTGDAYKYQTSTSRQYRFEVTNLGGAYLAHCNRSITGGLTSVPSSGAFNVKDVTIQSGEYTADDDGYDKNGYKSVASSAYFTSGNAPKAYLQQINAQLRMTLSFEGKENDDAYEYLQLLFDNTTTCDNRSGCSNGDPGNISLSTYMAGFEMNTGSKDATYRSYTFPVTSVGDNASATNPWGYGTKWPLSKQKFNNSRASDGRIVVPMNFSSIVLRLNASGSSGSDEWAVKNVKAHIQAVDATAPAKSGDPVVSPGPYGAGTTVYISVPFSEIVTVSGTPYLHTDWGDYDYFSGSGSNVLTFSGTIPATFGATLITRSLSGTITDLAGNALASTDCYKQFSSITVALPWGGSGTQVDPYVITRAAQLDYMATRVNANYGADSFNGKYFVLADDIAYSHTINWNTYSGASSTTENNFTPIGRYGRSFPGHFDGQGHTISGIRVWTEYTLTDNTNESLGLFGYVSGGSVSNVILRDANIRGLKNMGGIVGYLSGGSVTNCTLYQVLVGSHAKANMATGMGIVAGYVGGTVTDCYYRDCIKGLTYQDGSNDITIMPHPERWDNLYTVTTESGVSASYVSGVSVTFDDASYYAEGCTFNLAYSGTIETAKVQDGYTNTYTITEGLHTLTYHDHIDATLTVPAGDCTVSVRFAAAWEGSGTEDNAYIITTPDQLDLLVKMVNGSGGYGYSDFDGTYFQLGNDIDYSATTDWDDAESTENNYTAIGGWRSGSTYNQFCGDFDGHGFTVSGIRIYKGSSSDANSNQGLFGFIGSGGSVHDLTLADARITGHVNTGGIVGVNKGNITGCTVAADVLVAASSTGGNQHGGIAGKNSGGTITGCTVSATVTATSTGSKWYGAVAGSNETGSTIENCLAVGATVPVLSNRYGVITGENVSDGAHSGTLTANYYHDCTVGTTANATNVGAGRNGKPADITANDGAVYDGAGHDVTVYDVTVTLASEGYGTYYNSESDVTLPAGVKARIVTAANGSRLTYETIADGDGATKTVPAGTAVMLQAAPGTASAILTFTAAGTDGRTFTANMLHGSDVATTTTDGTKYYKLSYNTGGTDIGWYWGDDGGGTFISSAHKAWLAVGSAGARSFGLPDWEEATGIRPPSISPEGESTEASPWGGLVGVAWYTLDGRKLDGRPGTKGLYIINGKKVVIE